MSVRQRILEEITRIAPSKVSNAALASSLNLNEPSVRRVTKELKDKGHIVADYSNAPWGSNNGVVYTLPLTAAAY